MFIREITKLLTEIKDTKQSLSDTQRIVEMKEKEIRKTQEMVSRLLHICFVYLLMVCV